MGRIARPGYPVQGTLDPRKESVRVEVIAHSVEELYLVQPQRHEVVGSSRGSGSFMVGRDSEAERRSSSVEPLKEGGHLAFLWPRDFPPAEEALVVMPKLGRHEVQDLGTDLFVGAAMPDEVVVVALVPIDERL